MQARGPLMVEHRLIERMIGIMRRSMELAKQEGKLDPDTIDAAVDFFRVYADRTHHGKEEEILFKDLAKKEMTAEDRRLMEELIEEHTVSRENTTGLSEANARYRQGEEAALENVSSFLAALVSLYPQHIEKEDKVFFPASRSYLSDEEEQAMLAEFFDFDRRMIHEKYEAVVKRVESD